MMRDMALVILTFMPALFAYAMILYVFFQDPVFSFWSGKIVAPLLSSLVVCMFGGRFKKPYRLLQAALLFTIGVVVGFLLPIPDFVDPTRENSMGPVFIFVGVEVGVLIVGKILLDVVFGLLPNSASDEDVEPEPFYT